MVVFHADAVQRTVFVQHAVVCLVGKKPAFFEAGEQFPFCKGDDGSEKTVFVPIWVQCTAVAKIFNGVEHFIIRVGFCVFAFGIEFNDAVFDADYAGLLHQFNVGRTEAYSVRLIVQLVSRADHVPEQRGYFVKKCYVFIFAVVKRVKGFIVKNAPERVCGDDVPAVADQFQYAFVVRRCFRTFQIQFCGETVVPFSDGGNEHNEPRGFRIFASVMEADQVDEGSAFPYTHGRIDDVEFQRLLFIVVFIVNQVSAS